jgi:hypothetical protein
MDFDVTRFDLATPPSGFVGDPYLFCETLRHMRVRRLLMLLMRLPYELAVARINAGAVALVNGLLALDARARLRGCCRLPVSR